MFPQKIWRSSPRSKKNLKLNSHKFFSIAKKLFFFFSGTSGQNRHCRPLSLGNHELVFFWARKVTGCFPSAEDPSKFDNLVRERGTCFGLYVAKLFPKKTPWIPQRQKKTWTICKAELPEISAYKKIHKTHRGQWWFFKLNCLDVPES